MFKFELKTAGRPAAVVVVDMALRWATTVPNAIKAAHGEPEFFVDTLEFFTEHADFYTLRLALVVRACERGLSLPHVMPGPHADGTVNDESVLPLLSAIKSGGAPEVTWWEPREPDVSFFASA